MSYLNHAHDPGRRATAIVTVGAVHALLAAGLVTGLSVEFRDIIDRHVIGTNIPLDPPKPEPTPTPSTAAPPVTRVPPAPVPPIPLPPQPGPTYEPFDPNKLADDDLSPFPPTPGRTPQPDPPAPRAFTPKRPVPSSRNWITDADYPRRAIVDEAEGSVAYRLVVGTSGRVVSCELTRPSGNGALDDATCRLLSNRARFEAATDESGTKVLGTYTGIVTWQLPD